MALSQSAESLAQGFGGNRAVEFEPDLAGIAGITLAPKFVIEPEHEVITAVEWRITGH